VETLLEAVWLADHLQGEWTAAAPHVPPPDRGDWLAAHAAVEEVLGESEVGYLVVADLGGAAEPLSVEPVAPVAEAGTGEAQVVAPPPIVLFQPPEPEEGWVEDEEETERADAVEEPDASAEPGGEEVAETEEDSEAAAEEPAAEELAEGATTFEVVSETGEVLTVEVPAEATAPPPPAAADPAPSPAPAPPPGP
ncbi:MAG: hypothetical protein ACRD2T_12035, partial [Thermoanaerobaculia bacterium]